MVEDHLKGWLVSRLTLAERLNLQRVDEQMDRYPLAPGAQKGRCVRCDTWLSDPSTHDEHGRCRKRRFPRGPNDPRTCPSRDNGQSRPE